MCSHCQEIPASPSHAVALFASQILDFLTECRQHGRKAGLGHCKRREDISTNLAPRSSKILALLSLCISDHKCILCSPKVLVHCIMGVNRAAWVRALARNCARTHTGPYDR